MNTQTSGKTGYTGGQFTNTIITERKADLNEFTFGKAGEGHKFTVNPEKQDYREYATEIINQIFAYAESETANKVSAQHLTVQILVEALHQITDENTKKGVV